MKLVLVGTRKGEPVVNWPGIIVTSLLISAVSVGGSILMYFLLTGTFGAGGALLSIMMIHLFIMIPSIYRGLRLPPDQLHRLD
jgi:hypothetical protein